MGLAEQGKTGRAGMNFSMPPPNSELRKRVIMPQALGPLGGQSAVLGRDALGSRATAFQPDEV
jgi:hypothetical protein